MIGIGQQKYFFLEIEVAYSKYGIFMINRKYVLYYLHEAGKLGCKTTNVLIEKNHRISL